MRLPVDAPAQCRGRAFGAPSCSKPHVFVHPHRQPHSIHIITQSATDPNQGVAAPSQQLSTLQHDHVGLGRREALQLIAAAALLPAWHLHSSVPAVAAFAAAAEPATSTSPDTSGASSPQAKAIEEAYDRYSASYDDLDAGSLSEALGFADLRQKLLAQATGRVLEVAVGTGLNLGFYNWSQLESLTAVDISQGMLRQAQQRVQAQLPGRPITFEQADVAALPLPSASFDCVVDTFSLCVFPDPGAALREMARVVKPGGRVLLVEHTRSDNALLAAYQDATASAVAATSKGCVWNQDLPVLLKQAGLQAVRFERYTAGTVALIEAKLV